MHEYSIVRSLLDRVESEAAGRHATAVRVLHLRIGELSGVEVELLRTAFETFTGGSICDGAELRIETVPVRWACPGCGRRPGPGEALRCSQCGRPAALVEGDEIVLARIEMEVPERQVVDA